jgi:hypothetical protein
MARTPSASKLIRYGLWLANPSVIAPHSFSGGSTGSMSFVCTEFGALTSWKVFYIGDPDVIMSCLTFVEKPAKTQRAYTQPANP